MSIEEREAKIVRKWIYRGKKCIIILITWNKEVKKITKILHDYYNVYVETRLNFNYNLEKNKFGKKFNLNKDQTFDKISVQGGITFGAESLPFDHLKGIKFFGFDTSHGFDEGVKHRNMDYMTRECESLADQIIKFEKLINKSKTRRIKNVRNNQTKATS